MGLDCYALICKPFVMMNILIASESVCQESSTLTDERKAPRWYDEGAEPHRLDSPKARYCHAYYTVLDRSIGEIERRFNHNDLTTVRLRHFLLMLVTGCSQARLILDFSLI